MILYPRAESERYVFRLPENRRVTILALKYEDGQAYLAIKKGFVSEMKNYKLNFKALSLDEIRNKIRKHSQ